MLCELTRSDYCKVRALFAPLRFHLASAAVLDGNNPGRVFVDDLAHPRTAFVSGPEGCYLAGDPGEGFCRALNKALYDGTIFGPGVGAVYVVCSADGWRKRLPVVFAPRAPICIPRLHYVCREVKHDWRVHLPDGFAVRRIDDALLNRSGVRIPDHIHQWIANNWGSTACFLAHGFGFAAVHSDEVVSWSLADCFSGDACEIGIQTEEAYRRRGLAAVTAAAAVDYALANGYALVGWHTSADNAGSMRTAARVGFEKERDYAMHFFVFDEAGHRDAAAYFDSLSGPRI